MGIFTHQGRVRAGWRVTIYLLLYVLLTLVVQTPIAGAYAVLLVIEGQVALPDVSAALQPQNLPLWLFTVLKAADLLLVLGLTYLLGRFLDRRKFVAFGLRPRGWGGDTALGLLLGAVQMAAILALGWGGGWLAVSVPSLADLGSRLVALAVGLLLFGLVAWSEELLFRGYVQTNLCDALPGALALGITSVLFALFHAMNPNLSWVGVLNLALAGAAMGYGRLVTGNLWLPVAYHLSWNLVQGSILGFPVSGMRYGGLLTIADGGLAPLLTGMDFGPEGGLLGTLILLAAFPVFRWWGGKRPLEAEPQSDGA